MSRRLRTTRIMMLGASVVIASWIGIGWHGSGSLQAASQQPSGSTPQAGLPQRALIDRYCVTCHNEKLKTAGLLLDKIDVKNVPAGAEVWEKVIRKLRTGAMPPAGMPPPQCPPTHTFFPILYPPLY